MEFNLVQVTTRAPFNRCYLCDDHVGPFVDCFKDQFGHGAVFICAPKYGPEGEMVKPGCVGQMAIKVGLVFPHETVEKDRLIDELLAQIADLKASQKVEMSYSDFLQATQPQYEIGVDSSVSG